MTQDTINQPQPPMPEPQVLNPQADDMYEDYWGTDETYKYMLPDGKQYFVVKPMDEGGKQKFQKKTNKGIRMNQRSSEATIDVDPADERWTLIKESVVDWLLMQKTPGTGVNGIKAEWTPFPFAKQNIEKYLEKANPKIIQDLEFFIRTKNPWMQADMDVEEIDKEIERLEELRKIAKEQQAGEDTSATK